MKLLNELFLILMTFWVEMYSVLNYSTVEVSISLIDHHMFIDNCQIVSCLRAVCVTITFREAGLDHVHQFYLVLTRL